MTHHRASRSPNYPFHACMHGWLVHAAADERKEEGSDDETSWCCRREANDHPRCWLQISEVHTQSLGQ